MAELNTPELKSHDPSVYHFGSDNYAGAHPEVLDALTRVSGGHVPAYGDDPYTVRLRDWARDTFGQQALIYPVFNGTGANLLSLSAVVPRWGSVIAAPTAHINTDETGAPEITAGLKILPAQTEAGKLTPEGVRAASSNRAFIHESQSCAVSLSNSTELGTVYSPQEFQAIAHTAHELDMAVHLDGSRLANAAVSCDADLADMTTGADIVSLGATKNGAMNAEAVLVLQPERVSGIDYLHKVLLQLSSKTRYQSAQLLAMFEGDLWQRNAQHANRQAAQLADKLTAAGFTVPMRVQANTVIAQIDPHVAQAAQAEGLLFYAWPAVPSGYRFMCAWDTPDHAIDMLVERLTAHRG